VENYWIGGLERFYFDLINGLPAEEFELTLFANPIHGLAERLKERIHRPFQWIAYHNLTTTRLDYALLSRRPRRLSRALGFVCRRLTGAPLYLYSQRTLQRLWQAHPADVVHVINGGYPGGQGCRTAALAARAAGCSSVLMSILSYPQPPRSPWDGVLDQRVVKAVNSLIPNSLTAGQGLVKLRHFPADKIIPIQGGIAPPLADNEAGLRLHQELGLPADSLLVGTVAVLEPIKGHLVLLDAVRQLQPEFPKAHFVFVGEGQLRPQLEVYLRAHQLDGSVSLLGHRPDVPEIVNAFDIFAFPSRHEGLPYAIQEAMALSKPIVASRVGGIPEEIDDGKSGLLVPPGDSGALADALRKLLRSAALRLEFGRAAQEKFRRQFTLQHMLDAFIQLYTQENSPC